MPPRSTDTQEQSFDFSKNLSDPFHLNSDISVCSAICAIMEFLINNKLTYSAIAELQKLLHLLCVSPNKLPRSVYQLKNV